MHFLKVSNRWNFVVGSSFDAKVVQCSVQFTGTGLIAVWDGTLPCRTCRVIARRQPEPEKGQTSFDAKGSAAAAAANNALGRDALHHADQVSERAGRPSACSTSRS